MARPETVICQATKAFDPAKVRIHLIGHSAGAIVHSFVASALVKLGWRFKTERGVRTPILGMEKYFAADASLQAVRQRVTAFPAPSADTESTTHGGFDDDATTMRKIVSLIKSP